MLPPDMDKRSEGPMEVVGERPALAAESVPPAVSAVQRDVGTLANHREDSPVEALDLPVEALERVWAAVEASTSVNTKAAYRSDWARFQGWAAGAGHAVLPADPMVVAAYLTGAAAEQTVVGGEWRYSPATLTRWASSINQFHTAAGLAAPGRSEVVRRALSGIRRLRATPPNRRAPLLLEDIRRLLAAMAPFSTWPGGVIARRDAALLLVGFATAARRSELVGLTVGDVAVHRVDGLHLRLRTSKTDQEARGAVKAVPYGRDPVTCPPCAYTRWRLLLDAADLVDPVGQRRSVMAELRRQASDGGVDGHVCRVDLPEPAVPGRALFPLVHKTGRIGAAGMSGQAVNVVLARRATDAGYTPEQVAKLGGHSLRAGFVTEAFRQGADAHAIMRQTGHRNPAILETYAREHAPLVGNAVTKLGL